MKHLIAIIFCFSVLLCFTQESDAFAKTVDESLALFYKEYALQNGIDHDSIIDVLNYEEDSIVSFPDSVYCHRLAELNKQSPFEFTCNNATLSTIHFFAKKRRGFTRIVLGRSELYFDLYEEKLSEYEMPLELKYLSVIESGLRPQVKSRVGATGLWQFMYRTGKVMGLEVSTYIDERMDPEKATDAACRYLKKLYGIYGDWNLALAAYNAGPGNVNKAIRRSGKKTYWGIRPYLPRETQGYVPNFIAAAYMLNYYAQHNIIPAETIHHVYELDTMCISKGVHFKTIEQLVNWKEDEIMQLNPTYRRKFIPDTEEKQCIKGPLQTIGELVSMEGSLYKLEDSLYHSPEPNTPKTTNQSTSTTSTNTFYHKVRRGQTLGSIASTYGTTVRTIMNLNGLRSTNIYVGQRLKIKSSKAKSTATSSASKKYYRVRSGDTFGAIARRYGKSVSQLKRLNPGINISRLNIGQQIRVR